MALSRLLSQVLRLSLQWCLQKLLLTVTEVGREGTVGDIPAFMPQPEHQYNLADCMHMDPEPWH